MVTVILIAATCLVSILCFTGTLNGNRLLLNAYSVWHRREWHRNLHLPDSHSGPGVYLRSAVSSLLLVHGKAQHGQYRPNRKIWCTHLG